MMKNIPYVLILTLLGAMLQQAIASEKAALVPLPSIPDFTRDGGWGLALGLGVEYESAYDGSDEYDLEFDPAGAVQWRTGNHMVYVEGLQLGWRGLLGEDWLVQSGLRYEGGLEPDDSDEGRLDGLEERDSHIAGFLEVRRSIGDDFRNWVGGFVPPGLPGATGAI